MSRQRPSLALTTVVLLVLVGLFVFVNQSFFAVTVQDTQGPDPIALIKTLLVGGVEKAQPTLAEVRVNRVSGGEEPPTLDMRLFAGDEITTGPNAQLTLLFLDESPEKSNEVLVDSNSRVRVGSIFTWLGRILIRCRGAFDARSEKVKLGVQGTEFELIVRPDGNNKVTVLEGAVSIDYLNSARLDQQGDERLSWKAADIFPTFLKASLPDPVPQKTLELVAVTGQTVRLQNTFTFTNRCRQRHRYEINGPRNIGWFRFLSAESFALNGRETRSLIFNFELDPRQIPVGFYEGEIFARCIDCAAEPSCDVGGLLLPVSIRVIPRGEDGGGTPGGPSPAPSPLPQKRVLAGSRQEVIVDSGGIRAVNSASESTLRESVNWSNSVILTGQPHYSAQSVVPHFPSWFVRDQQFREARMQAVLRDDPRAYEVLGDVYTDWGNGAKAIDAYSRARRRTEPPTAGLFADEAEAFRLAGNLERAEASIKRALDLDPQSSIALNTLGNVYRDRAVVARDRKDFRIAEAYLERARVMYERALAVAPSSHHAQRPGTDRSPQATRAVIQSNLGEVFWERGEIAREQGRNDEALRQFESAEGAFQRALETDQSYPFAKKGLGDVYHSEGEATRAQGNESRATQSFDKAQQSYREALTLNRDMAEAHVGLGNVSMSLNHRDEAIRNYLNAARLRPEQPEPHFRLALAFADINPRLSAEYAATFLKLEPKVFHGGERTRIAERLKRGERIAPPTPTRSSPTPRTSPTPGPDTGTLVKIPGLRGDKPQSALNELRNLGLQAQLQDQPDCEGTGKVSRSDPEKDQRVPKGTLVTVFVSSFGNNPVTVPKLTGAPVENADRVLRSLGLNLKIDRRDETDSVAPGTVVWQDPKANAKYKIECEVKVRVAVPIPPVRVPRLIGMRIDEARLSIGGARLSLGNVTEVASRGPEGMVIDQFPREGETVPRGARVNLTVSQITRVVVPQVIGQSLGGATETLSALGLRYRVMGGDTKNDVIKQDPPPGRSVPRGTVVRLWFREKQIGE